MTYNIKTFIGIDLGKKGGIAILNQDKKIIKCLKMPFISIAGEEIVDIGAIESFLKDTRTRGLQKICIEDIHCGRFPRTAYSIGSQKGSILAGLYSVKDIVELVSPQKWKKHFMLSTSSIKKTDKKKQSVAICEKYYHLDSHHWTGKKGGKLDGIAEAILIARYSCEKNL